MPYTEWEVDETTPELLENIAADSSLVKYLPSDTEVLTIEPLNATKVWSRKARLNVRLPTDEEKSYFLKLTDGDLGRVGAEGEYASTFALWSLAPDMISKPLGHGTFELFPNIHFFMSEYVDLDEEIPDPQSLCPKLADLHRRSLGQSPYGSFGFNVNTCSESYVQDNMWSVSWEALFARQTESAFKAEKEVHGPCDEYSRLLPALFGKVIPRLLRPLETGGNNIRPVLVHGDVWDDNVACYSGTERPCIVDAKALWAHNEYELHKWRGTRFRMRKAYIKEYIKHFPISTPQEDFDDRNLLYSLRADLHDSCLHPETKRIRALVIATLETLVYKFPQGYEGPHCRKGTNHANLVPSIPQVEQAQIRALMIGSSSGSSTTATEPPSYRSSVAGKGSDPTGKSQLDRITQTTGLAIVGVDRPSSEVRFGESAISPFGGSEVGGYQS